MELFNGKIVCPLCDGEGIVKPVLIKALNLKCYVCDECNATWFKTEDISENKFEEFSLFMEKNGLSPNRDSVTWLEEY